MGPDVGRHPCVRPDHGFRRAPGGGILRRILPLVRNLEIPKRWAPPLLSGRQFPRWSTLFCVIGAVALPSAVQAQFDPPPRDSLRDDSYFYHALPGSDSYAGPLDVLLNKGFNFAQAENRTRAIFDVHYSTSHVWNSLAHPFQSIDNTGGFGKWVKKEILPIQAFNWIKSGFRWDETENMTWYPNYMGHFIEGGITSRRLAEKFRAEGVPYASTLAGMTTMMTAMVNEAYTHQEIDQGTGGTVADLYVFDLGGVLVFTLDPVANFFANKLHAQVWPSQASLTAPNWNIANNANNLVFKFPLPFTDRFSIFWRTAIGSHLGLTTHLADGYDLSFGFGADASRQNLDPVTGRESVDIRLSSSLYLDRGGSVLASIHWSEVDHRLLAVNVYPGVFSRDFGAWVNIDQNLSFQFGISHRLALGLGLGMAVDN